MGVIHVVTRTPLSDFVDFLRFRRVIGNLNAAVEVDWALNHFRVAD